MRNRYTVKQEGTLKTLTVSGNLSNDTFTCTEPDDQLQDPANIPETELSAGEVLAIGVCVGPGINGGINFISKLEGTNEPMATQSSQAQTLVCSEQTAQPDLGSNNMENVELEDHPLVIHISGTIIGK